MVSPSLLSVPGLRDKGQIVMLTEGTYLEKWRTALWELGSYNGIMFYPNTLDAYQIGKSTGGVFSVGMQRSAPDKVSRVLKMYETMMDLW